MRRGFTLIELLVVLFIITILVVMVFSMVGGTSSYQHTENFKAEVMRKFEYDLGGETGGTQFRVEVRREGSEFIETIINTDDGWQEKYNSGTIQANLTVGDWYEFHTRGERNEKWSMYPNIITATPAGKPLEAPE